MKSNNKLLVVLGILIALLLTYYLYKLYNENTLKEGFKTTPTLPPNKEIKDSFGNIIFNESINNIKDNTLVMLPGRFKVTGLQVSTKSTKSNKSSTYKVFIADNEDDIANPDKRKLIASNKKGNPVFEVNKLYNNPLNFEKEGIGLYIGKVLLITTDDSNSDIRDINPLPSELDIKILGLEPFAISFQDYDKMIAVNPSENDCKVGYINFSNPKSIKEYRIKYSNTIDNNSNNFSIEGPNRLAFTVTQENPFIFFSKPVIVNKLYIYTKTEGEFKKLDNDKNNKNYTLYGSESVSKRDRANFKLQQQSFDEKHMIVEGEKCPNVGEMINKQLQAQQICEALEYKDKARNKKLSYEKDKVYLGKLAKQDQEIEELENIVRSLIEKKNTRLDNNEGSNIDNLEKEMLRIEKIREDAESQLKNNGKSPTDLKVKLNLDPEFQNIKKQASLQ